MKKLILTIITTILILLNSQMKVFAQGKKAYEEPQKIGFDIPIEKKFPPLETLKDVLETRRKMKEIEKQTIENDHELKAEFIQLMTLKKQMKEKLEEKLKGNEKYQELKKKLEEIESKIKEKIKERR